MSELTPYVRALIAQADEILATGRAQLTVANELLASANKLLADSRRAMGVSLTMLDRKEGP